MKNKSRFLTFVFLFLSSLVYTTKEPIPDLNIPLSSEDFIDHNVETHVEKQIKRKPSSSKRKNEVLHEMSNKKHESIKVMSPNTKQITIDNKILYSDTQRTKWRESKIRFREKTKNEKPTEQIRERWKLNQRKYRATLSVAQKKRVRDRHYARQRERMAKIQHPPSAESKDDKVA